MDGIQFYSKAPPVRLFFTAAIPGIISMFVASLWGFFEGIMVARHSSEIAFAAVNLGVPIIFINFALADLIGVGSSVPISIALGQGKNDEANNYFTCACISIVVTGALMGVLLFASSPLIIKWMGADGELAELAILYIRTYAVCSPFTTIVFAMDNYLRISGKIKTSMVLNILMSALIMALLIIFVAVMGIGVVGAALGVSIGMAFCGILAIIPFAKGRLQLKFCKPQFRIEILKKIIVSGSPVFLSNIAARLTSILMNVALLKIGGAIAVTVYGVLMYIGELVQPILYGACDSLQPAIGYNYGAGDFKRVRRIESCCVVACAVISILSTIVIFCFPENVALIFVDKAETETLTMTVHALKLFAFTYLTRWFGFAIQSYLVAINKPGMATILSVSNALLLPLILLLILQPIGLDGIWLNSPITALLVSLMACLMIVKKKTH